MRLTGKAHVKTLSLHMGRDAGAGSVVLFVLLDRVSPDAAAALFANMQGSSLEGEFPIAIELPTKGGA